MARNYESNIFSKERRLPPNMLFDPEVPQGVPTRAREEKIDERLERQYAHGQQYNLRNLRAEMDEKKVDQYSPASDYHKTRAPASPMPINPSVQMGAYMLDRKKDAQQRYRDILDQQMAIKDHFKMYGNMTSVEKAMNKQDLTSYKNYDTRQHSLVPGLQHHKHIGSPLAAGG